MTVDYKRDVNKNYMIIDSNQTDYRMKMISVIGSEVTVPLTIMNWNGKYRYSYDISVKQPLTRVFSKRKIGKKEIQEILFSFSKIGEASEQLFLDIEGFVADPEYIYWDLSNERISWIFYPYESKDFDLTNLSEFLLEHVDNSDPVAVKAVYGLYKQIKEQCFNTDSLYELMYSEEENDKVRVNINTNINANTNTPKENASDKEVSKKTVKKGLRALFEKRPKKEYEKENWIQNEDSTEIEPMFPEDDSEKTELVILNEDWEHRLISLDKEKEGDIEIREYPMIVGTREDCVDWVLHDRCVSKMHLQIDKVNDKVVIRDLNSRNGSYVNGIMVNGVEKELESGDEVKIGNLKFLFQ